MKWIIFFINFVLFFNHVTSFRVRSEDQGSNEPFQLYDYNSYATIENHLRDIEKSYPDNTEIENIGTTYENRSIRLLKIFKKSKFVKPILFIDANIHAREWVSSAIALNLINELLQSPELLIKADWYIIPMLNPDGYEYSRTSSKNRYWRKNRSLVDGSSCAGVDLNRNFPYHWGESGVSQDRCAYEIYDGPKPLSEAESIALSNTLLKHANRIKLYLTLHAYGGYIVYPYGYALNKLPENWKDLKVLGKIMANAMEKVQGTKYTVINSADWYPAAGASDDYSKGVVKIPYVFTIEFTKNDFVYPKEKLKGLFKESMEAFKAAYNVITKIYKRKCLKHRRHN